MNLGKSINFNELPKSEFTPIPAGTYMSVVDGAEIKTNKSQTGRYINVAFKITGPQYAGRIIFYPVVFESREEKAFESGQKNLRDLMEACCLSSLSDTDQLLNKTVQIKVKIAEAHDGYKESNQVSKVLKPAGLNASPAPNGFSNPQSFSAMPSPAPNPSNGKPSWLGGNNG